MRYFKIEATIDEKNLVKNESDNENETLEDIIDKHKVREITEEFNKKNGLKAYIFLSEVMNDSFRLGAFLSDNLDLRELQAEFIKEINIKDFKSKIDEISFLEGINLIKKSDKNGFISDDGEILEKFGIDNLQRHFEDYFSEIVLEERRNSEIVKSLKYCIGTDKLSKEIQRIVKSEPKTEFMGHPVHYYIKTNDSDSIKFYYKSLLCTLYNQKRIFSKRVSFYNIYTERVDHDELEALFKNSVGGTIVINAVGDCFYNRKHFDEDDIKRYVEYVLQLLKKYKHQVLTIFCIPYDNKHFHELFFPIVNEVAFVNISENEVNFDRACGYLVKLAKERKVKHDSTLFYNLQKRLSYYPSELKTIFEKWYDENLRNSIYPQYKDAVVYLQKIDNSNANENAYEQFQNLVGLFEVKRLINKILCYNKLQKIYKDNGAISARASMHMVFTGNPGTAKTTVARLFARIMQENGLLSTGAFYEVSRQDLIAKYVGWTAKAVCNAFEKAKGGVLFIDEAYSLLDDRKGSFGDEAISAIVQQMENMRDDVIVIFAGYSDKMQNFLDRNEGLRSRIAHYVDFKDYSTDELYQIAEYFAKTTNMKFSDKAVAKIKDIFNTARSNPNFGNGRFARNLIEHAQMNMAERIMADGKVCFDFSVPQEISEDDIDFQTLGSKEKRAIGFSC